jgi:ATP-dependent exoDNAse (exonuclease V) beta subunit
LHPFRPVPDLPQRLEPIAEALRTLATLHRQRNRRPIAETINTLLECTRAHAGFVFRPSGDQVLANVHFVADQARAYERGGGISFRGFVDRLVDEAETHRTAEAPILEEGSDGVRIMTVHRAKGLEFPVVILADMTANSTATRAFRYTDSASHLCAQRIGDLSPIELLEHQDDELRRERAEGVRIAYVAATRARDLLVVPAIGDEVFGGGSTAGIPASSANEPTKWVAPLNRAIYPPRDRWQAAEPAPDCPAFRSDSVVHRPESRAFEVDCVRPGLHRFGTGGADAAGAADDAAYDVVWWDPHVLQLGAMPPFGIRQEALLDKNIDPEVVRADVETFTTWKEEHDATAATAATPKVQVQTATARAELVPQPGEDDVRVVDVMESSERGGRPAGRRFGTLVHAALASVPLDADRDAVQQTAVLQGRILGAPEVEVVACAAIVHTVLQHDLLERARAAAMRGGVHREVPVTLRERDGVLVEGVVDLAFRDTDGWVVVDFKTDQELGAALDTYRRQVCLYARAIHAATGEAASAVLLRV